MKLYKKNSEKTVAELKQEKKLYGYLAMITWAICGLLSVVPLLGMPEKGSAVLAISIGATSFAILAFGGVATVMILLYVLSASFELRIRQIAETK